MLHVACRNLLANFLLDVVATQVTRKVASCNTSFKEHQFLNVNISFVLQESARSGHKYVKS